MAKKIKLKEGDLVEIEALDHTSDDQQEGWQAAKEANKITPCVIQVAGWFVSEDADSIKVALAKVDKHYSTFFIVLKGAIKMIKRHGVIKEKII